MVIIGLRRSRQREVILKELRSVTSHPNASELCAMVRKEIPSISLGTVYRNLELLAENGIIQKLDLGGGQARFDGNPHWHLHVRCACCAKVTDVFDPPASATPEIPAELNGYELVGLNIEYVGVCPACNKDLSAGEKQNLLSRWKKDRSACETESV